MNEAETIDLILSLARQMNKAGDDGTGMTQVVETIGAGEGNRTLVISLEGCCSTIELHPRTRQPYMRTRVSAKLRQDPSRPAASRSAAGATAGGGGRTRTYEGVSQRIYSPPPLPLGTLPRTVASSRMTCGTGRVMGSALRGVNRAKSRLRQRSKTRR